ncbi:hypothetical protein GDO78_011679 [Eleutherodactylus coqui]|uniref:Uncharacterized protein n=1 Tax=Eleutherodactylus coqui TaxID=57060 RepID=A0A8J6K4S1_ELECQ|nr:hypothetical protein GDO78_011679 [Eleutherodactylus coqui]
MGTPLQIHTAQKMYTAVLLKGSSHLQKNYLKQQKKATLTSLLPPVRGTTVPAALLVCVYSGSTASAAANQSPQRYRPKLLASRRPGCL